MRRISAEMYLQMWLSEQIPPTDWLEILKGRADVEALYNKYAETKGPGKGPWGEK